MGTINYNLSGFSRVLVKFAMDVEIVKSDTYSVVVSGAESYIDDISVNLEGDRLVIGYKLTFFSFFTAPFSRAHVLVNMPLLKELQVTGAAVAKVSGFNSDQDFGLFVSGASHVDFREFAANNMNWDLSGASHIEGQMKLTGNTDIRVSGASRIYLKGSTQNLMVDASGASQIDLKDFSGTNGKVRLSGASRSWVNLNCKLDVDLSGASNLEYDGQVGMGEVRVNGASTLKKH